jgi:hypothetical protein
LREGSLGILRDWEEDGCCASVAFSRKGCEAKEETEERKWEQHRQVINSLSI